MRGAAAFALGSLLRDGTSVPTPGIPNASERERGVAMALLPSCADASPLVRHEVRALRARARALSRSVMLLGAVEAADGL